MSESRWSLFGTAPRTVAAPESIAEAQDTVRQADGLAVAPWGGGTRQLLGYPPVQYDLALSTERLNRITEYQPADLVVTAQAGVTLAQLQSTLAEQGQFFPLDAALPEQQTLGGLVSARADNLRRRQYGSVRDLLLGVSVVNARGELVRGGGKVVKNVAGYDLPKLYCGSLGTLGLLVEVSVRVAPLPAETATVVAPLDAECNSEDALDLVLGSGLEPAFLFLLNGDAGEAVLPAARHAAGAQYLVVGLDGMPEAVGWQLDTLGDPGQVLDRAESKAVRGRLRDFALQAAPLTASFHILSSQVGAFVRMLEWTARRARFSASVAADAALGLVWAHFVPWDETALWPVFFADLQDKAARCGGSFILERMPDVLRAADMPVWSPLLPDFPLMQRLKEMLDPGRMWNPGRFVGRI